MGNGHHLFLVEDQSVGFPQDLPEFWMEVAHLTRLGPPLDKLPEHTQRPRPAQGQKGDDIPEGLGLEAAQQLLEKLAFQLEDA